MKVLLILAIAISASGCNSTERIVCGPRSPDGGERVITEEDAGKVIEVRGGEEFTVRLAGESLALQHDDRILREAQAFVDEPGTHRFGVHDLGETTLSFEIQYSSSCPAGVSCTAVMAVQKVTFRIVAKEWLPD